jgi:RND family efflux transporter MFP subunit
MAMLAASALAGCGRSAAPAERASATAASNQPPRSVVVGSVREQPLDRAVSVLGSLAALDQAVLSLKVAGRLQSVPVDLGSRVRQGDVVAQVEPQDYELRLKQSEAMLAQARARLGLPLAGGDDRVDPEQTSTVKQAQAVLAEASKNRDRVARLTGQGIVSQSELETTEAAYQVAANRFQDAIEEARNRLAALAQRRVEVDIARKQLADATLHAPFDGAVQERIASVGEFLAAGAPVARLVRTDPLRLRLEVPEREAAEIRLGQVVRLSAEGDTNVYRGEIARLSPALEERSRMLIVEADVRNTGRLRPGLLVRAQIIVRDGEPALTVPRAAVTTFAGVEKVFLVRDGKAAETVITTGRSAEDRVEVTGPVRAGETVVLAPGNLQTGQRVEAGQGPASGAQAAGPGGGRSAGKPLDAAPSAVAGSGPGPAR